MQSVSITTYDVSLNPAHGEVYSIQHYVIKIVIDFRQVGGFLLWYSDFLHQQNWPPWYIRDIVKSGIKHSNPYPFLK